jgi:RNA recognition motif-containing protein
LNRNYSGGKRQREADRARKKKDKEERLRHNRELRARGIDPSGGGDEVEGGAPLPEVKLEDVVISVPSQPRRDTGGPTKLFVGGLSWNTTADDLRAAFSPFGTLVDAMIISDRATGRSRGFGFVTFESSSAADEAIKQMNGKELDGRSLKVNRAEAR